MKFPAASAPLALLCFLLPLAAESDTNLRYQLEMQRAQTRDAQEQASRERGARMDLQRELAKARDSSASVGAAQRQVRGATANLTEQVKANNDSALERAATLTEVGERAVSAGERSANNSQRTVDKTEIISDRQLTQIWGLVIVILGLAIRELRSSLKEGKTHALVQKVETNSNGHMAALIKAKDDLLATAKASADAQAASDAGHRALLQQQIEQLRRLIPAAAAKRKPRIRRGS